MRFSKPRAETTFASNPGGVELKPLVYARYFPGPLLQLTFGAILAFAGLLLLIFTKGASALLLLLGARLVTMGWQWMGRIERHFLKGCALPGIVVATKPITVAALTDLSTGGGATYNTVKIVKMPKLKRAGSGKLVEGDRVPVVALYSGRMPTPKWDDFYPSPVLFATNDPTEVARVEASIGQKEWREMDEALTLIPKPYRPGLYPVDLST
ncbi:DUF3239 domain-containing protein [bacterium]|nr:MAG: DUF3239 domain-containing protein [bacterium]